MNMRRLGNTGEKLSVLGMGGIVVRDMPQEKADSIVAEAIDRGVNYFDVAPTYGDAEEKLGWALRGKREKVFLACKTKERSKEGAAASLRSSLERLQTTHFDLYQLHQMHTEEDFAAALGPGGALEALLEAKQAGLIRHIGFSAHSAEIALQLIEAYDFETILFPVNWVCYFNANFGPQVIKRAQQKGMGCLGIKTFALTEKQEGNARYPKSWYLPIEDRELAALSLRFTLSQPVTAAVSCGDDRLFPAELELAEGFRETESAEIARLHKEAEGLKPIFPRDPENV